MKIPVLVTVALLSGATALSNKSFPNSFIFGVATAAYQVEGGWNEGGRGPSMWDEMIHTHPEKVDEEATADVACDSYHKYEEDIELIKGLNAGFYRFSISWTRIFNSTNEIVNMEGVDHYLNILKLLKENNIEPIVTIYHFDLPEFLQEMGGWTNPDIVPYFGVYARACFHYFGDYVKYWITVNEPSTTCMMGYGNSEFGIIHAPGYHLVAEGVYLCAYTQVKAHALAYHIYQDEFKKTQKAKISVAMTSNWFEPNSNDSSDDVTGQNLALQFSLGLFAHPIYVGNWPDVVIERVNARSKMEGLERSRLPEFTPEDVEYIKGTYDWFGLNYYTTLLTKYWYREEDLPGNASYLVDGGFQTLVDPAWKQSETSTWLRIVPWGLRRMLQWIHENYNQPEIIITENGWSDNGILNDTDRISYLEEHLSAILESIYEDKVNVIGYTHWSLLDNFEWTSGYTCKFGLVQVDFDDDDRTRTPKQSYYRYQDVISSRCLVDKCSGGSTVLPSFFILLITSLVIARYMY